MTLQYDKVLFILEPNEVTRPLARQRVMVFDYPDGRLVIKHKGRELPYRTFDKVRQVDQAAIVENKRLGAAGLYRGAAERARRELQQKGAAPRRPDQGDFQGIPRVVENPGEFPCILRLNGLDRRMIGGHFLGEEDRAKLIALARDGLAASRVTRRANALVLLDDGWSGGDVAAALLLDDDTVRNWRKLFEQRGIEGLTSFDMGGSAGFLSAAQEDALKVFVSKTLPRSTRHVGAWIEKEFGLVYEGRSGLIARCIGLVLKITSRTLSRASSTKKSRRLSSRAMKIC